MKGLFSSIQRDWASWSQVERVAAISIVTLAPAVAVLGLVLGR